MAADFSKFGYRSCLKCGEEVDEPVSVYGFEKSLAVSQWVDFDDSAHHLMDFIEQL